MTAIVRYVDTASSGGDGTTQNHSGGTAAFASLSVAESTLQQNLTDAGGDTMTIYCAGSTADGTDVTIAGWTTDATHFVTIAGDPTAPDGDGKNNGGAFSTGHYRLHSTTAFGAALTVSQDFTLLSGIQVSTGTNNGILAINLVLFGGTFTVEKCRMRSTSGTGSYGIYLGSGSGVAIYNNCTAESAGGTMQFGIGGNVGTSVTAFNCTVGNTTNGLFNGGVTTCTATNCASFNNTDDVNGTWTLLNCAEDDSDAHSGRVDISPGGTEATDWNNAFTDYANGDFRVKDTSSLIYNAGTSTGAPATDIIGTSRPQAVSFDIGAWELIVAAAAGVPIRGLVLSNFGYKSNMVPSS